MSSRVVCVRCPKGCVIDVTIEGGRVKDARGYGCNIGLEHAREEVVNPMRVVCTTVRIRGGRYPRLPVRTSKPVPRERIREVIEAVSGLVVEAPVERGSVIVGNVAGTGADIIAETSMEREERWSTS
ncbi:MAG: DUF1667 domain-containing protein [Thermofilaceae archaeon]